MKKYLFPVWMLFIPGIAMSGTYTYQNTNGTLAVDYTAVTPSKTLQTLSVNGSTIATNCYEGGQRTPDSSDCASSPVYLQVRAFLQGPYNAATGLMRDDLRVAQRVPITDPYTAMGDYAGPAISTKALYMLATGGDAIVDWVLLELRNADNPAKVEYAIPALLQSDGDVVQAQTFSPGVTLDGVVGSRFYVSLRHRNHLGVITATALDLKTVSPASIDFSSPNTAVRGDFARVVTQGIAQLWAGDANHDERIIYQGTGSDTTVLMREILLASGNTSGSLNYIVPGYLNSDVTLDGDTIYSGAGSDATRILGNIYTHPGNTSHAANYVIFGGLTGLIQ